MTDPTVVRRQDPLKTKLDGFVWTWATYVLPGLVMLMVLFVPGSLPPETTYPLLCASTCFWALAYEAVTTYRRRVAVPLGYDLSLDPPCSVYLELLFARACLALTILVTTPILSYLPSVCLLIGVKIREFQDDGKNGRPLISGRPNSVRPARYLREAIDRDVKAAKAERTVWWGGMKLDIAELLKNFLLIGAVGSGKTLTLKRWLQEVLPLVDEYKGWRAMVVDPKWELYSFALAHVPAYKIKLLNPADARSFAWNTSADLRTPVEIFEACQILIPSDSRETQPFFPDGARRLLYGVITALNLQAPGRWWFSDVVIAAENLPRLRVILNQHPETRSILQTYVKNDRVLADIFTTLDTKLADYIPIAAAWSHQQREEPHRTISLREWVDGNFILLVGKRASAGTAHFKLIQLLLKRASQLLLDGPTGQSTLPLEEARRTIIAVEEAPRAGKLDVIDLATNGRDYGIGLCMATQSMDAMLQHFDKREDWEALTNEFHSLGFLSVNSTSTAEWMSKRMGKVVKPEDFQSLRQGKKIGPECVPGAFHNSERGVWYEESGLGLGHSISGIPNFVPAPDRPLRPWDEEDLRRLNLLHLRDELGLGGGPTDSAPSRPGPPSSLRRPVPRFRT